MQRSKNHVADVFCRQWLCLKLRRMRFLPIESSWSKQSCPMRSCLLIWDKSTTWRTAWNKNLWFVITSNRPISLHFEWDSRIQALIWNLSALLIIYDTNINIYVDVFCHMVHYKMLRHCAYCTVWLLYSHTVDDLFWPSARMTSYVWIWLNVCSIVLGIMVCVHGSTDRIDLEFDYHWCKFDSQKLQNLQACCWHSVTQQLALKAWREADTHSLWYGTVSWHLAVKNWK